MESPLFDLGSEDVASLRKYISQHPQRSLLPRWWRVACGGAVLAFFGIPPGVLLFYFEYEAFVLPSAIILLGQTSFLLIALTILVHPAKKGLIAKANKWTGKSNRIAFDPEWLRYSSPSFETALRWTALEKVVVSDCHTFVFTTLSDAYILPRRAFASADDYFRFANTARQFYEEAKAFKDNAYEDVT